MKQLILILAALATTTAFFLIREKYSKPKEILPPPLEIHIDSVIPKVKLPIRVIYFQDCSGSITKNGIEVISSNVFRPYYDDYERDIELNFGLIDNLSAEKLVTLSLPAARFQQPKSPDFQKANIVEEQEAKQQYVHNLKKYVADSIRFGNDRSHRINDFNKQIDVLLSGCNTLSSNTDLVTAITVADRVFNFSSLDHAKNFLLLNSDGLDTYNRTISQLSNTAEVVLINASNITHTSIDSIITKNLGSSEQAIQFSLHN